MENTVCFLSCADEILGGMGHFIARIAVGRLAFSANFQCAGISCASKYKFMALKISMALTSFRRIFIAILLGSRSPLGEITSNWLLKRLHMFRVNSSNG